MLVSNINTAIPSLLIVRIEVERLFGRYTYTLTNRNQNSHSDSLLSILYGDNGSGKTTILKLLFHLLSPSDKPEHNAFLWQTPFSKFSVILANGTQIVASRQNGDLVGDYKCIISPIKETGSNETNSEYKGRNTSFIEKILNLELNLFFIKDNRVVDSNIFDTEEFYTPTPTPVAIPAPIPTPTPTPTYSSWQQGWQFILNQDFPLKKSIERTERWVRDRALRDSNAGTANVHSLYAEIIAQIIGSARADAVNFQESIDNLIEALEAQEKRSKNFSNFGLMSPLSNQKIIDILKNAPENTHSIIWEVLKPYLDSMTARMDALQDTQNLLTLFTNKINKVFFHDKEIRLHVQEGMSIFTKEGSKLEPEMLSSGERQLLLLFCNTLTARERATIFMIDEPEISLNIKWQRQLIQTLLALTEGSQVQLIIATQSLELLSQYLNNIVKLENPGH